MALVQVTVVGQYVQLDGVTPASGQVIFALVTALRDSASGELVTTQPRTVTLDASGTFSIALVATEGGGLEPTGAVYQVTEQLTGAPVARYTIALPATPNPARLVDLRTS